jgi:hypothetical protein
MMLALFSLDCWIVCLRLRLHLVRRCLLIDFNHFDSVHLKMVWNPILGASCDLVEDTI